MHCVREDGGGELEACSWVLPVRRGWRAGWSQNTAPCWVCCQGCGWSPGVRAWKAARVRGPQAAAWAEAAAGAAAGSRAWEASAEGAAAAWAEAAAWEAVEAAWEAVEAGVGEVWAAEAAWAEASAIGAAGTLLPALCRRPVALSQSCFAHSWAHLCLQSHPGAPQHSSNRL